MISKVVQWWKDSPKVRMAARAAAVAVIAYAFKVYNGDMEFLGWAPFIQGAIGAAIYTVIGLLGLEPFVGIKPRNIQVPDNADQELQELKANRYA